MSTLLHVAKVHNVVAQYTLLFAGIPRHFQLVRSYRGIGGVASIISPPFPAHVAALRVHVSHTSSVFRNMKNAVLAAFVLQLAPTQKKGVGLHVNHAQKGGAGRNFCGFGDMRAPTTSTSHDL